MVISTNSKIKKNFLVVSSYFNDIRWIEHYTSNYIVYDKSKINVGYNLSDYFTYIIEHYDSLPPVVIFMKGNLFPRHVTLAYWESVMNNETFTPLEDPAILEVKKPNSAFTLGGGYEEINHNWFTFLYRKHPIKFFNTLDSFLKYVYKNPPHFRYVRFAPGANYIVPKENILKLPKVLYENMRTFVSHHQLSAESHIIERALYTLWTSNYQLNEFTTVSPSSKRWIYSKYDLEHLTPTLTDS